jgi:hypothetical protein
VHAVSFVVVLFCSESGKHQNEKDFNTVLEEFKVSGMENAVSSGMFTFSGVSLLLS